MNRINCLTHQRLRIFERFQHLKILLKLTNEDQRNLHTEINNFTVKKTKKKKKKKRRKTRNFKKFMKMLCNFQRGNKNSQNLSIRSLLHALKIFLITFYFINWEEISSSD